MRSLRLGTHERERGVGIDAVQCHEHAFGLFDGRTMFDCFAQSDRYFGCGLEACVVTDRACGGGGEHIEDVGVECVECCGRAAVEVERTESDVRGTQRRCEKRVDAFARGVGGEPRPALLAVIDIDQDDLAAAGSVQAGPVTCGVLTSIDLEGAIVGVDCGVDAAAEFDGDSGTVRAVDGVGGDLDDALQEHDQIVFVGYRSTERDEHRSELRRVQALSGGSRGDIGGVVGGTDRCGGQDGSAGGIGVVHGP